MTQILFASCTNVNYNNKRIREIFPIIIAGRFSLLSSSSSGCLVWQPTYSQQYYVEERWGEEVKTEFVLDKTHTRKKDAAHSHRDLLWMDGGE